jgi:hypothetical protein
MEGPSASLCSTACTSYHLDLCQWICIQVTISSLDPIYSQSGCSFSPWSAEAIGTWIHKNSRDADPLALRFDSKTFPKMVPHHNISEQTRKYMEPFSRTCLDHRSPILKLYCGGLDCVAVDLAKTFFFKYPIEGDSSSSLLCCWAGDVTNLPSYISAFHLLYNYLLFTVALSCLSRPHFPTAMHLFHFNLVEMEECSECF